MTLKDTLYIVFPGRVPEAVIFLRCQQSHVFTLNGLGGELPEEHRLCYIFGSCPRCKPTSVYPHAAAAHYCAFCNQHLHANMDRTFNCLTRSCWLAHAVEETGTAVAVKIWDKVWRNQGNAYFFGGDAQPTRLADDFRNATAADIEAAQTLVNMSQGGR